MQAGTDDQALIEASRNNDRDAFARIIERHHRAVYAVAYSATRDRAQADDVTQDTFVLAWRKLDELRDPERLAAWLCGIARNLALAARRQGWRETVGEAAEPIDGSTPFEALTEAQTERLVAAGLAEVPDVYREPLVLFYYQDRSVEDVARALGITPATTNKRLSRGRHYLAERVAAIESGLTRRGPAPALVGSVLAAIALVGPASHVDASPVATKGSTMSKFVIAATITAAVGAGGLVVASTMSGSDAHAKSAKTSAPAAHDHDAPCLADLASYASAKKSSTGGASTFSSPRAPRLTTSGTLAPAATDCGAVGRHLAELEADATHGPNNRPDEATCEKCAGHYITMCESEGWTAERRACALAAGDLINAHLCAGGPQATAPAPTPTNELAPELQCTALAQHLATTAQAGGLYTDIPDMAQQIDAACQLAGWPIELRQCFAAGRTVDALKKCMAID